MIKAGTGNILLLSQLQQQFIAAVLLPEETLKVELGQIKRCYGISMEGIVRKAQACGIVTRLTLSSLFSLCSA